MLPDVSKFSAVDGPDAVHQAERDRKVDAQPGRQHGDQGPFDASPVFFVFSVENGNDIKEAEEEEEWQFAPSSWVVGGTEPGDPAAFRAEKGVHYCVDKDANMRYTSNIFTRAPKHQSGSIFGLQSLARFDAAGRRRDK